MLARPMTRSDIERLHMLRRDLLRLRNAVGPLVDVCQRLVNAGLPQIRPTMAPMFRDVTDHVRTVQEKIDNLREVLAFAFEASVLVGQAQETQVQKRLAAGAGILAIPTAIAGIYGMNFKNMPELELHLRIPARARHHLRRLLAPVLEVPEERLALGSTAPLLLAKA